MDSNARESPDARAEFRKPANDAGNRKYRRRSPGGGSSSSSDGQFLHMVLNHHEKQTFTEFLFSVLFCSAVFSNGPAISY